MNMSENICIQFDGDTDSDVDLQKLESLIQNICMEFKALNATVHIRIVNDAEIIEVHQQFLNKNTTTDVLSFDLSDEFEPGQNFQIVVNLEQAHRQGKKRGHSAESELALYITHGMLHNLGFDDKDEKEAKKMHETEDALLQELGFGIIYNKHKNTD
jgi:probable rRNA maturation factor